MKRSTERGLVYGMLTGAALAVFHYSGVLSQSPLPCSIEPLCLPGLAFEHGVVYGGAMRLHPPYALIIGNAVFYGCVGFGIAMLLRRRPRKGPCVKCGYNLTGNESGICPECGTRIERPPD
jgi:hypothetical protein